MGKNLKKIVTLATIMTVLSTTAINAVPVYAANEVVTSNGEAGKDVNTTEAVRTVSSMVEDYKEDEQNLRKAGDFEYTTDWVRDNDGKIVARGIKLVRYVGASKDLKIEESFDGKPITAISKGAFKNCTTLNSITLSQNVIDIDPNAFEGCTNLQEFKGHNGVYEAYNKTLCTTLKEGTLRTLLKVPQAMEAETYTVDGDISTISNYAFEGCSKIQNIAISDSVKAINGGSAFSNCNLKNITASEKNESFATENGVLFDKNKTTIIKCPQDSESINPQGIYTKPESVVKLSDNAFQGCGKLSNITLTGITTIGDNCFEGCGLASVNLDVQEVGKLAFNGCKSLSQVYVSETVKNIGYGAFNNCEALTTITVNPYNNYYVAIDNVLYAYKQKTLKFKADIDKNCVPGAYNVEEATKKLDNGVELATNQSYDCHYSYENNTLNKVVTITGVGHEKDTPVKTPVTIDCKSIDNVKAYKKLDKYEFPTITSTASVSEPIVYTYAKNDKGGSDSNAIAQMKDDEINLILVRYPQGKDASKVDEELGKVTNNITDIEAYAFQGCKTMTAINLKDKIAEIGGSAFKDCTGLTTVTFKQSTTKLGGYAFSNCTALQNISLPTTLEKLDPYTFNNCSSLATVTFDAKIGTVNATAFDGCTALTDIKVANNYGTNAEGLNYKDENGVLYAYNKGTVQFTLVKYPSGKQDTSYEVPDNVSKISNYAFRDSGKIDQVKVGTLQKVTLPAESITVSDNAFFEPKYNVYEDANKTFIAKTIKNDITDSKFFVFADDEKGRGQAIRKVKASATGMIQVPTDVIVILPNTFENLSADKVKIPTTVKAIDDGAFDGFTNVNKFEVESGNTSFYVEPNGSLMGKFESTDKNSDGTDKQDGVVINTAKLIKHPANDNNSDYVVPEETTEIIKNAFESCRFRTISLGAKVTSVNAEAFNKCKDLKSIAVNEANTDYKSVDGVLFSHDGTQLIKYPAGKTDTEYQLPEGVTNIKAGAFAGNTDLVKINSTKTVNIENGAFDANCKVNSVTIVDEQKPPVIVVEAKVAKIEVVPTSIKTKYNIGDALDLATPATKMVVTYDNNQTETKDITADMVTGFDSSAAGDKTLTVTYKEHTTTFTVTVLGEVKAPTVTKIELSKDSFPKACDLGKDLDLSKCALTAYYSDGSSKVITVTKDSGVTVTGFDKNKEGAQKVSVSYAGQTDTFDVTVTNNTTKEGDNRGLLALGSLAVVAIAGSLLSRKKKNN